MFQLIWKDEVIEDDISTRREAIYLQGEYNMAYGGGVTINKQK